MIKVVSLNGGAFVYTYDEDRPIMFTLHPNPKPVRVTKEMRDAYDERMRKQIQRWTDARNMKDGGKPAALQFVMDVTGCWPGRSA